MNIGFIGLGVMGKSMCKHLIDAGYKLHVYNRTKEKCEGLNAIVYDDVKSLAQNVDVCITMVGFVNDVEDVYFNQGLIENLKEGSYIIDMTTTSPSLSIKIYNEALKRNIYALDAPVSGGDIGAINATLSIMVGGDKEVFEKMLPILKIMGKTINYMGKAGNGQHTKMSNQIVIAGTLAGVVESIVYAKANGIDLQNMLDTISKGAAASWQLSNLGQKIIDDDFNPGFFIKHFIKDMTIANDEALLKDINLEVLNTVLNMEKSVSNDGLGEKGTQALIKYYEKF